MARRQPLDHHHEHHEHDPRARAARGRELAGHSTIDRSVQTITR